MFASFLPNASSNLKLAQNGPAKSNRFSVRVFKTQPSAPSAPPPFQPYTVNSKVEPAYRPTSQREQPNSNWYPPSNSYATYDQRPRMATNYAIYPSANNDTFIYEQSACSKSDIFSNSELDSPTTDGFSPASAFSPAMSTDSTVTLPRTVVGDRSTEDLRNTRTVTPTLRPAYPPSAPPPQAAMMGRATSTGRQMHEIPEDNRSRIAMLQGRSTTPTITPMRIPTPSTNQVDPMLQMAQAFINIPEYAASTLSEAEVNERDFLAKRNAELNSTPTASFYSSSTGSSSDGDRRRSPSAGQPISPSRDAYPRAGLSQPMPTGVNFPPRPLEPDYPQSIYQSNPGISSAPFPTSSPPRVERLPSHLPAEAVMQNGSQSTYSYASLPNDTWSRDATLDSEHPRSMSYRTSPSSVAQPFDGPQRPPSRGQGIYAAPAQQDGPAFPDRGQDRPAPVAPMERSRSRRISMVGPRPDLTASRPLSEYKDYGSAPRASSDVRQLDDFAQKRTMDQPGPATGIYSDRRDMASSPPRGEQTSPRETSSRAAPGAEYRRDSRTPSPRERERERERDRDRERELDDGRASRSSRRDSYAVDSSRAPQDSRSRSQPPNDPREYVKSAPLSSSPTEIEAANARYPSQRQFLAAPTNERAPERPRLRSISFSNSSRPTPTVTIPYNGQVVPPPPHQPYPSESRNDYDRSRGERSPPSRGVEVPRSTASADFDRRAPASQGVYYSQPPAAEYQNPQMQRPAATISMSSSRAMDRAASTIQAPPPRAPPQERADGNTRSRTYPDPAYAPPHPEPVRRFSDGENPYERSAPRAAPYDKVYEKQQGGSAFKVMNPSNSPPAMMPLESIPLPEPHRRNSDGDQSPPLRLPLSGRNSAPLLRSVRWNENLVCPSPILTSQRRKGWFNRRGDQLWTNDGAYKAAPQGQEYPQDLDEYPEVGEGWMNEECIRIDLAHRLIPKPPLRSALKQARN